MEIFAEQTHTSQIFYADVIHLYDTWASPTVIVSDGPYGVKGFPGDPPTPQGLEEWYRPHIAMWSHKATPETTLWFWNTEIGWATVHPILEAFGWEYRACNIWDKGIAHIAGNSNTQSLRQLPIVTEVCVQYVKKAIFHVGGQEVTMQDWLRHEWSRTGLPFSKANEACGVKNAATRKYFTKDYLWYFPPPEAFEKLANYANSFGRSDGRPYFSVDGIQPISKQEWERYRTKFYCPLGITNVWRESAVNGKERIKDGTKAIHLNQKPLKLMEMIISMSSDEGDLIWEPFGGLCTASVAAYNLKRQSVAAEIDGDTYHAAVARFQHLVQNPKLNL
jgi:site-specific DNA-methyltransferase (adenine-specific)